MRRTVLLLASMGLAVLLACGIALAAKNEIVCDSSDATCEGTDEDDLIIGTLSNDNIYGDKGADTIKARGGNDLLIGQEGSDRLLGGTGNDTFETDPGADTFEGGAGADTYRYYGGHGQDTIIDSTLSPVSPTDAANRVWVIGLGSGEDFFVNLSSDSGPRPEVRDESGNGTIDWDGNVIDNVIEGSGDTQIAGNAAANTIIASNGGADTVLGRKGDDYIDVSDGEGDDEVDCGEGYDTYSSDGGDDVVNCENEYAAPQ